MTVNEDRICSIVELGVFEWSVMTLDLVRRDGLYKFSVVTVELMSCCPVDGQGAF